MQCNLCHADALVELGHAGIKPIAIASDLNLCPHPSRIYRCQQCGHLQKLPTTTEWSIIDSIYANYEAHRLSGGNELFIWTDNAPPQTRSYHCFQNCLPFLPQTGKLLDLGTGSGAVLKSASQLLPDWQLFAFDLSDRWANEILSIPKVVSFTSGSLANLPPEQFDLIVLWHVLEHIPEPVDLLKQLHQQLAPNGLLLIQVPDITRSPFDFAVFDHCSHFTSSQLLNSLTQCGFSLVADGRDWVHNCLTLLVKTTPNETPTTVPSPVQTTFVDPFNWLNQTVEHFAQSVDQKNYAIFGTGIAGIWLASQLPHPNRCFIDEDPQRRDQEINHIPICTPDQIADPLTILMPFSGSTGLRISQRLKQQYPNCQNCEFILSQPDQ